jgi:hypothetical protein
VIALIVSPPPPSVILATLPLPPSKPASNSTTEPQAESRGCTNSTGGGDQWAPGGDRGCLIPLAPSLPLLAADLALMSFKQTFLSPLKSQKTKEVGI